MSKPYNVAVVGATGLVGQEFLRIALQRRFPIKALRLLASSRSAGRRLAVGEREIEVEETTARSFDGVDLAFFSATTDVSHQLVPAAVKAGAIVIDDSSAWRMEPNVPLVVPEVNAADLDGHEGIISIPNCPTTPLVQTLWPLHQINPVKRIIVDTYQSVSGTGAAAVEELRTQSKQVLALRQAQASGGGSIRQGRDSTGRTGRGERAGGESACGALLSARGERVEPPALRQAQGERAKAGGVDIKPEVYPHQIAFNALPQVEHFLENGYTNEEMKMLHETRKILHAPDLMVSATCVRVPVAVSHSEAIHLEFDRSISPGEVRDVLSGFPGVAVVDDPESSVYPMPIDAEGEDDVFVGRIRRDVSHPNGIAMWVVSDNLRKGAALNALQIAEEVLNRKLLRVKSSQ